MGKIIGIDLGTTNSCVAVMDGGEAKSGDVEFMAKALDDIGKGNERGRLLAQGTARVGEHFGIQRVPVIKKQALSAYDPRVVEVTGISMMLTAQGADHTTGNLPAFECADKTVAELVKESFNMQVFSAIADSLGLCIFGRSVTNTHLQFIAEAINHAHGTDVDEDFIWSIGVETLRMEKEFNRAAGFVEEDDELPEFFHAEALPPTDRKARLQAGEVNACMAELLG